ncbi:hypothetical protein ACSNOI_07380 [Actinomadura kijaniata]|uniref:hypothetical protein n=1 Tax=Actinomadura kijaniata TaxID=46161 RepID=UPI003F1A377D
MPHVQLSQNSPEELREQLKRWMTEKLHGAVIRPSAVSEPGIWPSSWTARLPQRARYCRRLG